jgi:aminoglycoside/choline kinase family phosphotransferase
MSATSTAETGPPTVPPTDAATARESAIAAFLADAGWTGAARRWLAGDASLRRYYRLVAAGRSAVLMDAPPPGEDVRPFVHVARLLREVGLSAPAILAADEAQGLLLLEDFGDDTYTRLLARGMDEATLYRLAVDVLIQLRRRLSPAAAAALPRFDDAAIQLGVDRLLDWYWPAATAAPATPAERDRYRAAWQAVLPLRHGLPEGLALFDYHVDNLMLLADRPGLAACGLLDFQGAVRASLCFDLMSLVEDGRRDVPAALRSALIERYLAAFPALDREVFGLAWAVMAAQRHARIIGTFARLRVRDGKPHYLEHLPRVWRHLEAALAHPALVPLRGWFDRNLPPALRGLPAALAA